MLQWQISNTKRNIPCQMNYNIVLKNIWHAWKSAKWGNVIKVLFIFSFCFFYIMYFHKMCSVRINDLVLDRSSYLVLLYLVYLDMIDRGNACSVRWRLQFFVQEFKYIWGTDVCIYFKCIFIVNYIYTLTKAAVHLVEKNCIVFSIPFSHIINSNLMWCKLPIYFSPC